MAIVDYLSSDFGDWAPARHASEKQQEGWMDNRLHLRHAEWKLPSVEFKSDDWFLARRR
jgi:hypothetical protein